MSTEISQQINSHRDQRRMVAASLMGSHRHLTTDGKAIHIWKRGDTFLARGRWQGVSFGETLGTETLHATARLRKLIIEIEDGTYVRRSELPKQIVPRRILRLTLRELINEFLMRKRLERGQQTTANYRARLRPAINFSEQPDILKRWPLASSLTTEYVAQYKSFLLTTSTTRNGRPNAPAIFYSTTQVRHCLETLRAVIVWGLDPLVGKLPSRMINPFDPKLFPSKAIKNPLRHTGISVELREKLIQHMDSWQLGQLSWSMVLPCRPNELAGLMIGDVNRELGWFEFGSRWKAYNFTKAKTEFVVPYPLEWSPLIDWLKAGRSDGPLLRSRRAFRLNPEQETTKFSDTITDSFRNEPSDRVQAEHDRKRVFRNTLRCQYGGVSEDRLAGEFKLLLHRVTGRSDIRFYDLRHTVTQGMKDARLPFLELRYLTGHACRDILNTYTSLRPVEAMAEYFQSVRQLIDAVLLQGCKLGLIAQ